MAVQLFAPGVYVDELPSSVRAIVGASTSLVAFVGVAARGPLNTPTRIASLGEYQRRFGDLLAMSEMSYAVRHFYQNGGQEAIIVRVAENAVRAGVWLAFDGTNVRFTAADEGAWGNALRLTFGLTGGTYDAGETFDLTVGLLADGRITPLESFYALSLDPASPQYVGAVLAQGSEHVRIDPAAVPPMVVPDVSAGPIELTDGADGDQPSISAYDGTTAGTGIRALDRVEDFNLLCVPFPTTDADIDDTDRLAFWGVAIPYCRERRAFAIVDPPLAWGTYDQVLTDLANAAGQMAGLRSATGRQHAAVYFPRVRGPDPLAENRIRSFQPSGMIAGIYARTDATRGVWKAPAGVEATLGGSLDLEVPVDDVQQGALNDEGVNVLRGFPAYGRVVWGARTLDGQNRLGSEWKYVPVRRMASFLEQSLLRGTRWAVFEGNDEPLWSQLRLNIGAFLHRLFREGAFAGTSPREAYFVKCDRDTTTQADIDAGVVNVVIGWAPLRPAEFVVLRIQQIAASGRV